MCVETSLRGPAPYTRGGASPARRSARPATPGRRLPNHDELLTAVGNPGITIAPAGELTREVFPCRHPRPSPSPLRHRRRRQRRPDPQHCRRSETLPLCHRSSQLATSRPSLGPHAAASSSPAPSSALAGILPGASVAAEPDNAQEGITAPGQGVSPESDQPAFDPGGDTALPFDAGPPPSGPLSGDPDDGGPVESEPRSDLDVPAPEASEPDAAPPGAVDDPSVSPIGEPPQAPPLSGGFDRRAGSARGRRGDIGAFARRPVTWVRTRLGKQRHTQASDVAHAAARRATAGHTSIRELRGRGAGATRGIGHDRNRRADHRRRGNRAADRQGPLPHRPARRVALGHRRAPARPRRGQPRRYRPRSLACGSSTPTRSGPAIPT